MRQLNFGEFSAELDESGCHGLFRGHEPVGLSDVPRKVLFILLEHRPRPVTAKTLLNALWHPGANPSNVAKQVRALRVAMSDDRSGGNYIRTIKKEGYAFVMPVTESPAASNASAARTSAERVEDLRRLDQAPMASVSAGAGSLGALGKQEWHLAQEKLSKDFRGSCLHDIELLHEAIEECDGRIRLIASHRRLRLHGRFPHEPILLPSRSTARGRWTPPGEPDVEVASRTAELIRHSRTTPIVVNVGSYAPACISVFQSLRRRYGLEVRSDSEDLSGRQQILRLDHDDEADFLLAPHAPFLLVGEHRALDYRWMTPVHAYEQIVLRAPGPVRGRRRKLLVYKGGSPEEQLMARVGIPSSAETEMVGSLEKLLAKVEELAPGDMVIAWEPLASGLESKHEFKRLAEFRCWLSLYSHKRWQRGALRRLKDQFSQLFISEWIHCRKNREWAVECLAVELRALEFFVAGSGLGPIDTNV
jgi:DNA-binding winged helix-turn-helix (wHTH) protein